jgi:uncharacterized protein YcbK (DUF882 family)
MGRRRFLAAGATSVVLLPFTALCAQAPDSRSLSFVHTHTDEKLSTLYFQSGSYQPDALDQINHLLRDFRTGEVHVIDPRVLDILFDLHRMTGQEGPYQVISGYRSPQTNAALRRRSSGVAEHSQHMLGRAVDVRLGGFATMRLYELARQMARGGVGFYPKSDFVHVDCGPVRFW